MKTETSRSDPDSQASLSGKNVWVMAKGYPPDEGGMQTYAVGVAEAYRRLGAAVTVFTQTSAGPRHVTINGVEVVDVGAGKGVFALKRLRDAVYQKLNDHGSPALFHGTTWRTSVIPLSLGQDFVVTFHGREFMGENPIVNAVMRKVARKARHVVTVSEYSRDKLIPRIDNRDDTFVAYNGVSFETLGQHERQSATDVARLFSLCRLEPRKNIAACVEACAVLKQRGHKFHYVIAGRGPEYDNLHSLICRLNLTEEIELAGFVPEDRALDLHSTADIFLHPQIEIADGRDFEGFGIVIADAMRAGSAVIVGKQGGAAELVEHDMSGLAIDGRTLSDLVASVEGLLIDPVKRAAMANAGQQRAKQLFTWDRHVGTILRSMES